MLSPGRLDQGTPVDHGPISDDIARGLLELRARIKDQKIPSSKIDETLNIATWNVREFGNSRRSEAAIHYIAEIMGQFDLIALVELGDDLADLQRVLSILGPTWSVVYSDMIPDAGGNHERIAFVYDKRAATFNGLAAEANPPRTKQGQEYHSKIDWWRAPYLASFRAGNFDFVVIAAHIRWGQSEAGREGELQMLADWVDAKAKDKAHEDKDILVMGDFNIPSTDSDLFKAVTSRGLMIPTAISKLSLGSNLEKNKRYDQILHRPIYPESFCNGGGVLDYYQGDFHKLFPASAFPEMDKPAFTFQLSDHLPLWVQINTDTNDQKLEQLIRG